MRGAGGCVQMGSLVKAEADLSMVLSDAVSAEPVVICEALIRRGFLREKLGKPKEALVDLLNAKKSKNADINFKQILPKMNERIEALRNAAKLSKKSPQPRPAPAASGAAAKTAPATAAGSPADITAQKLGAMNVNELKERLTAAGVDHGGAEKAKLVKLLGNVLKERPFFSLVSTEAKAAPEVIDLRE